MSHEDEFSISEVRRKHEQAQTPPAPVTGSGAHGPAPTIHVGPAPQPRPGSARAGSPSRGPAGGPAKQELPVDPWRMLAALKRHWVWLLLAAVVLGALGGAYGYRKGRYATTIKLMRQDTRGAFITGIDGEPYRPEPMAMSTMADLMMSPEVIRNVSEKTGVSMDFLYSTITIVPQKEGDFLWVNFLGKDPKTLVKTANTFASEAIAFTRKQQLVEPEKLMSFYKTEITGLDAELDRLDAQLQTFQKENGVVDPQSDLQAYIKEQSDVLVQIESKKTESQLTGQEIGVLQEELRKQNPLTERLQAANARLLTLQAGKTEQHPDVIAAHKEIELLEKQIAEMGTNWESTVNFPANSVSSQLRNRILDLKLRRVTLDTQVEKLKESRTNLQAKVTGLSDIEVQYAELKAQSESFRKKRAVLAQRQRDVQTYEDNARGYYRLFADVTDNDIDPTLRKKKAVATGAKGAFLGLLAVAGLVFLMEVKQQTIKTAAEAERITGLRVLAALGDLEKMSPADQEKWAFRAWTIIAGQLTASPNHGMVCGITSSQAGEGRSTWIRLLGNAASQRGLRVLTVATKPSAPDESKNEPEAGMERESEAEVVSKKETESNMAQKAFAEAIDQALAATKGTGSDESLTLSPSALAFPAQVAQKFAAGDLPAAHIPLPGWVWNLDRRRQWQMALAQWRAVDNLVLLVELPPADMPEAVLLAESLPQILWLVDSGKARNRDTKEQLEMMRHAKCRIVGAVLNHEPDPIIKL
jgi:uncharacterized protein involved in exopolysaccharide biosynthesis